MNTKLINKTFSSRIAIVFIILIMVLAVMPSQSVQADTAGFSVPSIYSNSMLLNPGNAYISDDVYVQSTGNNKSAIYGNFGFSIPAGATINLVEVSIEGHGNKNWKVAVSNNNGVSFSAYVTRINTGVDTTTITGGPGTLWGLTGWTPASLNNSNFKVKIASAGGSASNVAYLDQLKVRVIYSLASNTPTTLMLTAPSAGTYAGTVNLQATLKTTSGGIPLSGKTIAFTLDGFSKGTATTNASGVATLSGVTLTTGLSGTLLNAGSYPVGATFSGDSTYAFSSDTKSQIINPLSVTVTANTQSKTYGANDPVLTYDFTPALIGADTFSGSLTRAAGENAGVYAINKGTLALSANYIINFITANLTITQLGITVTADNKAVFSGNPDPTFTFSVSKFVGTDTFIAPPACSVSGVHTVPGPYAIVCSGGNAGANYSISYVNGTLTVTNKVVITVTADNKAITYGSTDPGFTFTYSPVVSISGTPPTCSVAVPHTNAGSYPAITCSGGSDTTYEFSYISGTLTVNPRAVTVTANPKSKTYGASDPALTYSFAPALISGDAFSGALVRAVGENVGAYAITKGTLTLGNNYTISYVGANLTITKAPLTVTADDQTIAFREADPIFTFQYDGFVNGEDSSVINTPPTCGVSGAHTALGTYPIVCSGGLDDHYSFSFVNGILTVMDPTGPSTTGVFRPSNGLLYLKNFNTTGFADIAINYGIAGDYPVAGDWDGNNTDTIGVYRNGSFYLRNSNTLGFADLVFAFGQPGDQPVAGDWNGDGKDTIGIYRPSTGQFLLRDSNSAGVADYSFYLGNVGDVGIAGDWDGDGKDTTGVFRPSNGIIFLKNTNSTGFAAIALNYGLAGDQPVTGDWNNDGMDTIGVYRNGVFYLRDFNTNGFANLVFALGIPGDMPIAGDWDGLP
jgi:hypothetical protein